MAKSNIEWTTETWNPIVGCSVLSPGCTNCYAMNMAARIEAMNLEAESSGKGATAPQYDGTTRRVNGKAVWTGKLALAGDNVLRAPLKRKKPTTYFVNSMSDLFHENVPDEWIDKIFAVMALCPQHTFQVLTKRAARMRQWFDGDRADRVGLAMLTLVERIPFGHRRVPWPLDNVWLGVSTERQQEADERIPLLLHTPAAVRFISAEPLLGPIDLTSICYGTTIANCLVVDNLIAHARLDLVISGGESGSEARPSHPQWYRDIRDSCRADGVAYFHKQNGEWREPVEGKSYDTSLGRAGRPPAFIISRDGTVHCFRNDALQSDRTVVIKVGKKAAGRLLDGRTHDDMPSTAIRRAAAE